MAIKFKLPGTGILDRIQKKRRKKEFKKLLKYGKPPGNTRPPMRLTNDPGPY